MTSASKSWLNSLCSLEFLRPKDLRKTSLNKSCPKKHSLKINLESPKIDMTRRRNESAPLHPFYDSKKDGDNTPNSRIEAKFPVTEKDFRIMQVIKTGKNWRTYMVKKESTEKIYAMKLVGKKKMEKFSITDQIAREKEILEKAKSPFIPKLIWSFENDKKFFMVMEYIEGAGSLHTYLKQYSRFSEEITRFYAAEILLTLEYLHTKLQITYSDLQPRNFLLDAQGHLKLIDYHEAKKFQQPDSANTLAVSATSSKETNIEIMPDFFGLGCLIYELLTGKRPFGSSDDEECPAEDLSPTNHLSWPCYVSTQAKDLIIRLIHPDIEERLGYNGINEIKKHPFFAQVNWEKMLNKAVYPPLIPSQLDENKDEEMEDEYNNSEPRTRKHKASSLDRIIEANSPTASDDSDSSEGTTEHSIKQRY